MNKTIFKIKISTILQFVLCLILAFIIWFVVHYNNTETEDMPEENTTTSATSSSLL